MAKKNRGFETFSLSFLDAMACGFGAVILLFMIISATMTARKNELNKHLSEQADRSRVEVAEGERNLVEIRNQMEDTDRRKVEAQGAARRIIELIEEKKIELADSDADTLSDTEHINKLKADLKQLEEENKRLAAASTDPSDLGTRMRQIQGDGNRQYLTGLKVGGDRILILLDTSASMLGNTIVNIIRRRNMKPAQKIRAPKWQRALRTVEWVTAQFAPRTKFQIVGFNEQSISVVPEEDGKWLDAADADVLENAIRSTRKVVPAGGTSLHHAFRAVAAMNPKPDNVILIIDSLPTQGESRPRGATVTGKTRLRLFNRSLKELPGGIPVNVILFPMEGDAAASTAFWRLAEQTNGSYMAPSGDWP
jgi:hypothetical protein